MKGEGGIAENKLRVKTKTSAMEVLTQVMVVSVEPASRHYSAKVRSNTLLRAHVFSTENGKWYILNLFTYRTV